MVGMARISKEARKNVDMTDEEWNRQWDLMMNDGVYEVEVADLLLPALSHSMGLDILIFNTYKGESRFSGANGPVLLSQSDCWGGQASKKPPMLIAYNGVHYDILKPASKGDEMLTKRLVKDLKTSRITLRYEECAIFSEIEKAKARTDNTSKGTANKSWAGVVRGERAQREQRGGKEKEKEEEKEVKRKEMEKKKESERREKQREDREAAKREEQRRKRREWKKIQKQNKRWEEMERVQQEEEQREKAELEDRQKEKERSELENKEKEQVERKQKEKEQIERGKKGKNNFKTTEANKDKIAKAKEETRKFEEVVKSLGMGLGNKRETLRNAKIVGEEMMGLIETVDGIQNISDHMKMKKKKIVTALNSLMDLNDLNIAKLERDLTGESSTQGQEGLGAAGVSSLCPGALSSSVANDPGHNFHLFTNI